ncbi:MAG: type II toxin-antitoxin system RatA family toxin [Gammaproteobacteria bacterium]|nr:type II toxin-antitoxin system RatA family toxin [Gammaproteobacteria bacterium]
MPHIKKDAWVNYSAEQMYRLVNRIEDYPQFLPWCHDTQVSERDEQHVTAKIDVQKGGFHKSFTTRVVLMPNSKMELHLIDGPFREFLGIWQFNGQDEKSCHISFALNFTFTHRLLGMVAGPVFSHIANTMVEAFAERAEDVYGQH